MQLLLSAFLIIINMSITAILIIIIVVAGRIALKKSPKILTCILWGLVFFKLVCPFSYRVPLNIIDSNKININYTDNKTISYFGLDSSDILNNTDNKSQQSSYDYLNVPKVQILTIASLIWVSVFIFIIFYNIFKYIQIKKKLKDAVLFKDNIYISDKISVSFVLGIFKPKIYIPPKLSGDILDFVITHEKKHIDNFDNILKFSVLFICAIHWFNPLVWLSFKLFSLDLEIMCDEKVIKNSDHETKKKYCYALLACTAKKNKGNLFTTGFSQNNAKARIKCIMIDNKKNKLFVSFIILMICTATSLLCLFNTKASLLPNIIYEINEPYIYISSDKLSEIVPMDDKMAACQIPEEIIEKMSTEALIESCINHPMFLTILISGESLYQSSFNNFKVACSAIQKLLLRNDLAESLFKVYSQTAIITKFNYRNDMGYNEFFRTSFLEILLAQPEVRQNASDKTMKFIEQEVAYKYNLQIQENINSKIGIYYALLEFNIN